MNILRCLQKWDYVSLFCCIVLVVGQVYLDLKLPEYLNLVIQYATTTGDMTEIWTNGALMLACALGSALLAVITGYFASRISAGFSNRVRANIFGKVQGFSMQEITKFSTPSLITRCTNDITQIQLTIAMGLQVIIKAPVLAIWAICKISNTHWEWTLAIAIAVVLMLVFFTVAILVTFPKFRKLQKQTDDVNASARENLQGVRVIRAYNAEEYQQKKFDKTNDTLTNTNMFVTRMMSLLFPFITLIMSGVTLAIYILSAYIFNDTTLLARPLVIGNMMEYCSYAIQIIMAFMMIVMIFVMLPRAITAGKRINEVMNTPENIKDGTIISGMQGKSGEVVFDNVSFKYPDAEENVLENISFTAKKGETVAFIGSTGSGKSTLINLVPRFYDATAGEITVDGVNVRDYKLDALHDKIGYIPQKAVLFSGTIASNVAYGDKNNAKLPDDNIKTAVEVAQAKDFVEKKEGQYSAPISQGGTNLSGGQKQRISIARAICRDPEIYIFDDTFSALDYKTDRNLRSALKKYTKDATVLIVAQRIGTIKDADKIIVLDNGKMVGSGTHEELLKSCPVYQEIALSQLSKEELENE